MKAIRIFLSAAWLAVAVVVLVSTISDLTATSWRPRWLATGSVAVLLSLASAVFLFFEVPRIRIGAIVGSTVYLLYWIYLFLISPPEALNRYAVTGIAVILLAVATIGLIIGRWQGRR